jgi:hypothetical protein
MLFGIVTGGLIAYYGGVTGKIYVAVGVVVLLIEWATYWEPLINDVKRDFRNYTPISWSDKTVAFALEYYQMNTRNAQIGVLPIWLIRPAMFSRFFFIFAPAALRTETRALVIANEMNVVLRDPRLDAYLDIKLGSG